MRKARGRKSGAMKLLERISRGPLTLGRAIESIRTARPPREQDADPPGLPYARACHFIASDPVWAKRFEVKGLPIVGDDIKAQLGGTITHRTLTDLFRRRGVTLDLTYHLTTPAATPTSEAGFAPSAVQHPGEESVGREVVVGRKASG